MDEKEIIQKTLEKEIELLKSNLNKQKEMNLHMEEKYNMIMTEKYEVEQQLNLILNSRSYKLIQRLKKIIRR